MNLDRMVPGFMPTLIDERQFSGASDHSDSKASHFAHGSFPQCFRVWLMMYHTQPIPMPLAQVDHSIISMSAYACDPVDFRPSCSSVKEPIAKSSVHGPLAKSADIDPMLTLLLLISYSHDMQRLALKCLIFSPCML